MRVSIPKSAAATFATVAGITGVQVEELYTAMITSSADAFFSALATQVQARANGALPEVPRIAREGRPGAQTILLPRPPRRAACYPLAPESQR